MVDKEQDRTSPIQESPKTETSRLKITQSKEPAADAGSAAEEAPASAVGGRSEETVVTDPMTLRDTNTSKVRRVTGMGTRPGPEATAVVPGSADSESGDQQTDTVQLKVVQQKKKEIADMMSPSSTVRLRAPGGRRGRSTSPLPQETLKITPPEVKPEATQQVPSSKQQAKTSTQPLKRMEPAQGDAGKPDATAKTTQRATPPRSGRSLKLKTGGGASRTIRAGTKKAKDADRTVKVSMDTGDQTSKLPAQGVESAPRSVRDLAASAPMPGSAAEPGVGFTLASVAAFAATGVLLYFVISQVLTHI